MRILVRPKYFIFQERIISCYVCLRVIVVKVVGETEIERVLYYRVEIEKKRKKERILPFFCIFVISFIRALITNCYQSCRSSRLNRSDRNEGLE